MVVLLGASSLGLLYLAGVLHYVLEEYCVLCLSLDAVHLTLLLVAVVRWLRVGRSRDGKAKRT